MRIFPLIGLLVLAACASQQQDTTPSATMNMAAFHGLNKTPEEFNQDDNYCYNLVDNSHDYSQKYNIYGNCMLAYGNVVSNDGYIYYKNYQPIPTPYCDSAPSSAEPCVTRDLKEIYFPYQLVEALENPPSASPIETTNGGSWSPPEPLEPENHATAPSPPEPTVPSPSPPPETASTAIRFENIVRAHQDGIFQAAHPLADSHDTPNVSITESNGNNATIVESINWKGSSGHTFQTVLQFLISYNNNGTVTSVDMKATDYGNPSFSAFAGLNLSKMLALSYVSGNLINEGRYLSGSLSKIISNALRIEDVVTAWLKYTINNPSPRPV